MKTPRDPRCVAGWVMRPRLVSGLSGAFLLLAMPLPAQSGAAASACDAVSSRLLLGTAWASVAGIGADSAVPRVLLETALEAFSEELPRPAAVAQVEVDSGMVVTSVRGSMSLPRAQAPARLTRGPHLILQVSVEFVLHHTGAVTDARVDFADAGTYSDSLRAWLTRDSDGHVFIPFPDSLARDNVRLRLSVSLAPNPGAIQQAVFRVAEPWNVTRSAALSSSPQVIPGYPSRAEGKGQWADLLAEFVVRANGTIDTRSAQITPVALATPADSESTRQFVGATRTAVKRWRFRPARRGACNVEQRLVVPVYYRARKNRW